MNLSFSLVICTYMRPEAILTLLKSVALQTLYPNEILVIDGSTNSETETVLSENTFHSLSYFKVDEANRGLTKQRNFGISKVGKSIDIVCFLDDDTVLDRDYFKAVIEAFNVDSEITGVGGVAVNENRWKRQSPNHVYNKKLYYSLEDYIIKESTRNVVRNYFGLQSPNLPGIMPTFSHGRTYSYPLNDKLYQVDLLVGMSFNFKRIVFDNIKFSTYFEGYGLYEDADYSLRALKYGKNIISTKAKIYHYPDKSGRPNQFNYGMMVVRNGWYVWRIKYPKPTFVARFKFYATIVLLTLIRATNVITTSEHKKALTETLGRMVGLISLIFNKPKIK